jgi:hypothetical protein
MKEGKACGMYKRYTSDPFDGENLHTAGLE